MRLIGKDGGRLLFSGFSFYCGHRPKRKEVLDIIHKYLDDAGMLRCTSDVNVAHDMSDEPPSFGTPSGICRIVLLFDVNNCYKVSGCKDGEQPFIIRREFVRGISIISLKYY